jgi:spore coat polysaccharide biosynthesis protein SpsF
MRLTYPLGVYGHVLPAALLHDLNARRDLSATDRVDVVRAVFEHPETYRILNLTAPEAYRHPELRLTIDHPEDATLLKTILSEQGHDGLELEALLVSSSAHPEWFAPVQALVQVSAAHLAGAVGYGEAPGGLRHG